jgi:ATP-dependent Lhr-like helicase
MGLAQLLAWRMAQQQPNTFSLSVNDYGFEILAARPMQFASWHDGSLLRTESLLDDVLQSLNTGQLAQRRFREIARVAGLVFGGYPGAPKSMKQLQASSGLFFEVFKKYDPTNRLLTQAEGEVLSQELEITRLRSTLRAMARQQLQWVQLKTTSPFALPLMVERFREQLSNEKLKDRLDRLMLASEQALNQTEQDKLHP